jgi:hypothetical protein
MAKAVAPPRLIPRCVGHENVADMAAQFAAFLQQQFPRGQQVFEVRALSADGDRVCALS